MADRPSRESQDSKDENGTSGVLSPRASLDSRASPSARGSSSLRVSQAAPSSHQHRQSLSDSLRANPASPRSRRQPSLTQTAIQSLIDNPPPRNPADPAFADRDWRQISIGELVSRADLRFVELDTGIEEAINVLIDCPTSVLLLRENAESTAAVGTFDYSDLNAYLLLAVGLVKPDEEQITSFEELAKKARDGSKIPLKDVKDLGRKNPLIKLAASTSVMTAVEIFGGGLHRVLVVSDQDSNDVVGVFSQFRLVKFLWENGRSFPVIDQLYPYNLKELKIGSHRVISINGDRRLSEALQLMNNEGISSLAVIDSLNNVVGNISTVDVKLLTRSTSLHLLQSSCIHFISVILSTRGLIEGKDSFPVFHVNPGSTLAHTVAKLVATKSHRLWVTDPQSPGSSGPPTPSHSAVHIPTMAPSTPTTPVAESNVQLSSSTIPHLPTAPSHAAAAAAAAGSTTSVGAAMHTVAPSISASALPGARLSGRLVGVVSLTDILNLYARASGLSPADPAEIRSRRRRSSSSSVSVKKSGDVGRELFSR